MLPDVESAVVAATVAEEESEDSDSESEESSDDDDGMTPYEIAARRIQVRRQLWYSI